MGFNVEKCSIMTVNYAKTVFIYKAVIVGILVNDETLV